MFSVLTLQVTNPEIMTGADEKKEGYTHYTVYTCGIFLHTTVITALSKLVRYGTDQNVIQGFFLISFSSFFFFFNIRL